MTGYQVNILFAFLLCVLGVNLGKSDSLNDVDLDDAVSEIFPIKRVEHVAKSFSKSPLPNVFEYVDSLYEDFIYFSNRTLLDALERLEEITNSTVGLESKTLYIVGAQLRAMTNGFLQQIDSLENQAKGFNGVDLTKCEGDGVKEIKALPTFALEAVSQCIAMPKSILMDQVNSVIIDVTKLPEKWIKIFGVYLRQCKHNVRSLQPACAANLGTKISQVKANFYSRVDETITEILNIFPNIEQDAVRCSTNELAAVSSRAAIIVSDLTNCANQIMFATDLSLRKATWTSNKTTIAGVDESSIEVNHTPSVETTTTENVPVTEEMPEYK